ncbi:MAG TPA: copper transporter, partial [Coriobacteriia bacterium]|nr:copper transporter [Coriobacteriia bacterium]
MYNLRYHVASLVAVFLALTVGLVLGTVVAEHGSFDQQSAAIVQDLQRQFKQLQDENAGLSTDLDRAASFSADTAAALVEGRLEGTTVAVLVNAGRGSGVSALLTQLERAGASQVVYTFETAALGLAGSTPEGLPALIDGDFAAERVGPASDAFIQAVAARLAAEWSSAGSRPVTELLVGAGVLSVRGNGDGAAADACVSMSSFDDAPDAFALAIATAMSETGHVALGAESATPETGVAAEAAGIGLSAVDHIDTPQGAVSLI